MHFDRKLVGVLVVSAISLLVIEGFAKGRFNVHPFGKPTTDFTRLMQWVGWCVVGYAVIPALFVKYVLAENLRDYGMQLGQVWKYLWAYLVMLGVVVPLAYIMSARPNFQACYPFYRQAAANPSKFMIWQLGYALQFICLEFFFRGFMVHGTEPRMGWWGVFLMTIPYCLIHLGKPMLEVYASIIAGIALGFLALKTRSIFWGAAAHITVAVSMDFFCLWRTGQLRTLFKW